MKRKTEREVLVEYYDQIINVLDTIKVGVFIADGNGNVIMMNQESEKTGGMAVEDIVGKNMLELQEIGYVDESSVLKAIESKKEVSFVQNLGDGGKIYLTAVPYYLGSEIDLVVCTERDVTEAYRLEVLLQESQKKTEKQEKELEYLRTKVLGEAPVIIAESQGMKGVLTAANRVAALDTTVLISGESGTGKEVIANYIQRMSLRYDKAYIKINCAAIPENLLESELFGYEKGAFTGADSKGKMGIFEMAQGGTLFLDEIAEMPFRLQAKLLRVLQEKEIMRIGGKGAIPVNVRIIAASNVNLKEAVEEGRFREDLYYRLNVIPIDIPPLRNRKEDIGYLTKHFVESIGSEYRFKKDISEEAISELRKGEWEGNIRELRNIIERLVIGFDGKHITSRQVKNLMSSTARRGHKISDRDASLEEILAEYERDVLIRYLEKYSSASEAARRLKIDKSTIGRKLKKYHIQKDENEKR